MIPIEKGDFLYSSASRGAENASPNLDRFSHQIFQIREGSPQQSILAVLAEGVEDLQAGEVAAEMAVETIMNVVADSQGTQATSILQAAILRAGQAITAQSEKEKGKRGMGSTVLCAWVIESKLYLASLGKSRLYLQRGSVLRQLNVVTGIQLDNQDEAEEVANDSAGYLGARIRAKVDLRMTVGGDKSGRTTRNQGLQVRANDRLLLSNEELSEALTETEISELLGSSRIDEAAENLVQAALSKGGKGNFSAIVIAIPPGRPLPAHKRVARRKRVLLIGASILLVLVSIGGWFFLGPRLDPGYIPIATAINTLTPIP